MDTLSYKTKSATRDTINKEWVVVDATDMVIGRLSSRVAKLLRGKHKPNFTPHLDCGDNVIVINAEKVKLTGKKWNDRVMFSHSGYPGGQKETTPAEMFAKDPARLVQHAVKGMLPKNKLGRKLLRNLYVYVGSEHKQEAQKPKVIDINTIK
ncbi:MAG: large subunit ribosomal protein [Anaerophaga sp.]|uniref:50S ribosomal protein L13 n=1 Tax=Anaerophaga thermohalophila TaxID=177400 RepID=UPI000300B79A|nr:50S ribosomal protein L13 [Anaerophaga thermohalophila]MDK2840541.1 large subunit ribosomal protein [Anaerophaga sp.]